MIQSVGFRYDDPLHLHFNPVLVGRDPGYTLWTRSMNEAYTPLTYTLWHWANQLYSSPERLIAPESVFYTLNLGVYLLSVIAAYLLLSLWVSRQLPLLIGGLIFALHPIHVEAVAWITGLRDLSSGLGILLSLYFFTRNLRTPKNKYFALTSFFFLWAILSKPAGWALVFLYPCIALFEGKKDFRDLFRQSLIGLLALPVFWAQWQANGDRAIRLVPDYPYPARLLTAFDSVCFYLSKLLFPIGFTYDYGHTVFKVFKSPLLFVSISVFPILWVYCFFRRQKKMGRVALFSLTFLFLSLLPTLGFNRIIFQAMSNVADRYVFVGVFPFAFFVAKLLEHSKYSKALSLLFLCFITYCAFSTRFFVHQWQDGERCLKISLRFNSRSWSTLNALAMLEKGRGNLKQSEDYYLRALDAIEDPVQTIPILNELTHLYLGQHRYPEALRRIEQHRSISDKPMEREYRVALEGLQLSAK